MSMGGSKPDFSERDTLNFYGQPNLYRGGNGFLLASYLSLYGIARESAVPWNATVAPWTRNVDRPLRVKEWHFLGDYSQHQKWDATKPFDVESGDIWNIKALIWNNGNPRPINASISSEAADKWAANWRQLVIPSSIIADATKNDTAIVIVGWDDNMPQYGDTNSTATKLGAWKIKGSWGTREGINGYSWIGYGAVGIGGAVSVYEDSDIVSNPNSKDFIPLKCDEGWAGETTKFAGKYMLVNYKVPNLPAGKTYELYAIDVFNPSHRYTDAEVRVYSNFDKKYLRPTGLLSTQKSYNVPLGFRSVDLAKPVPVKSGQTVSLWLRLNTSADLGYYQVVPVSEPTSLIQNDISPNATGNFSVIARKGDYLYLAGGTTLLQIDVRDPANPVLLHQQNLSEECIRLVPVGGHVIAGLYKRNSGNYAVNKTIDVDAKATSISANLPVFAYDTHNVTSWRPVNLNLPQYSNFWDHPNLPFGYNNRKRVIYNDPCLAALGDNLYFISNRYQDRYNAGANAWRFWWDFTRWGWSLTDPYNPTPLNERVFRFTKPPIRICHKPHLLL